MSLSLDQLTPCFQGLIPATLYTCSNDGVPNVAYLSHVDYVDANHVALSNQFFNKSRRNIAENPNALVRLYDPDTMQCYRLRLRYSRSETDGPLFDAMSLRIEAIASHSGLKGIFALRAADIYEVLAVETSSEEVGASPRPSDHPATERPFTLATLGAFTRRTQHTSDLEALLESALTALEELFDFRHSMILLAHGPDERLVTLASRGYPENGVGSEVGLGEGIIGMVAEARQPIRVSGLLRDMLYAEAVRRRALSQGLGTDSRIIPLPGLPRPQSQLGLPLEVDDALIGVLCIESEEPYRFHEEDRAFLELLGRYLALGVQTALLRHRADETLDAVRPRTTATPPVATTQAGPRHALVFYRGDECVMIDDSYLIRGIPAKILWKLLREHEKTGRSEFTNRELRLDRSLGLPDFRDNLESRLILLRRRLEQRVPAIRVVPCGRGRFHLELDRPVELEERA